MSDVKHTAGEWAVFNKNAVAVGQFTYRPHWPGIAQQGEMEANARLIAAAPDMLEALRGLLQQNEEFCERTGLGDTDQMEAARAAISKALTP